MEEENVQLSKGYNFLLDDFGFEICTISEVLEDLLKTSKLPEDVDKEFSNKLLIEIRNEFYSKSDVD